MDDVHVGSMSRPQIRVMDPGVIHSDDQEMAQRCVKFGIVMDRQRMEKMQRRKWFSGPAIITLVVREYLYWTSACWAPDTEFLFFVAVPCSNTHRELEIGTFTTQLGVPRT